MNTDFTLDELKLIRQTGMSQGVKSALWDSISTKASLAIADTVCAPPKLDAPTSYGSGGK